MTQTTPTSYEPKLSPNEVSRTISALGVKKANTKAYQLFLLAVLAGLYISIGGHLAVVAFEQGMGRIIAGAVFGIGLTLVVIAGAELFTGNVTMFIGAVTGLYPFTRLLRNWGLVYVGNFVGSYLCALLIFKSGLLGEVGSLNSVGKMAVSISDAKMSIAFSHAFLRGVFCNILVILAIILAFFAKDIISKIVCCILPIMAFVTAGFEHCVANMYLVPLGFFAKGMPIADQTGLIGHLIPVTLGNIVGGIVIMVIHPNRIRQIALLWSRRKASSQ
ncbi:MAG: formate/nitrite transporter family protein [Planctomycetes bacterium]|jgi:formate/nitrite transporter|nr:formate/nitrite transporter family protein [Planctomycetota bacterium]